MLLDTLPILSLQKLLAPAMDEPTWPGLHYQRDRERLRNKSRGSALWDSLDSRSAPQPIEVWPRSVFRQFQREGIREPYQKLHDERLSRVVHAAIALWLEHPLGNLDYVQDLLWAYCESTTWLIPAHEHYASGLELGSSRVGCTLAEIGYLLQDHLEEEVNLRLGQEIDRRILDAGTDWRIPNGWSTCQMNWNHVCNSNLLQTALYRIRDSWVLAHFIHPVIQRLDYALGGFAADGGCLEGPGYWAYGFGHYVEAAVVLHQRTHGALDLLAEPRVEPICRYPVSVHFDRVNRVTVADSGDGRVPADIALMINHLLPIPELLDLAGEATGLPLTPRSWRALALVDEIPVAGEYLPADAYLPETGLARAVATDDPSIQVAISVGHNGVPHNHNDVGSFLMFAQGSTLLTDPGAPRYTRKTFGEERYEIIHTRTLGHSLPILNGVEQSPGEEYHGSLQVENFQLTDGASHDPKEPKRMIASIGRAYPIPTLHSLTRTLTLFPDGMLRVEDRFHFEEPPESIEEGFVTFAPVVVEANGRSVRIGEGNQSVLLRAEEEVPGVFTVRDLVASVESDRRNRLLRRISFTPESLEAEMTLTFILN